MENRMNANLRCEWCQKSFARPATRGPVPRYCSAGHRQAAYIARLRLEVQKLRAEVSRERSLPSPASRRIIEDPVEALAVQRRRSERSDARRLIDEARADGRLPAELSAES